MSASLQPDDSRPAKRREGCAVLLLAAMVLIPTEIWCAQTALETQGEVMQAMLWALFWSNVIWGGIAIWFTRAALIALLALALAIIPYQVFLLGRLTWLNSEMMQFVDARLRLRAEGKPIPSTLDDYKFSDSKVKRFIHGYGVSEDGKDFFIAYFVIQPGITHSYNSKTGWFYYPD